MTTPKKKAKLTIAEAMKKRGAFLCHDRVGCDRVGIAWVKDVWVVYNSFAIIYEGKSESKAVEALLGGGK